ncbi:MAG: STT3 domain-containing protein [Candidatus ainarchaeum sp.]|nr:STT3 domain-containing protein [Candidatus ainarchaeum sp.]
MIEFSPLYLLLVLFIGFFVPGMLLSLGLLKRKELPLFDKAGVGLGLGIVVPALIAFLLSLVGVMFSHTTALISIFIFYAIGIAAFVKEKAWEQLALPKDWKLMISSVALALLLLLSFWIRMQTYSPVFMELDPYYYMFITHMIIVHGEVPLTDQTAWYPLETTHRGSILKPYAEALQYSIYTNGGGYDKYLLSDIAGSFPAVLAALAVFFLALFISAEYKREFGIIAAAVFAFIPMFLTKTLAGESEIQPYAFFALAFFFAMYALAMKRKDYTFAGLAGLALASVIMGSASAVVAYTTLLIFVPLQALLLFYTKGDLKEFVKLNAVVLLGAALMTVIKDTYTGGAFNISGLFAGSLLFTIIAFLVAVALAAIKEKVADAEAASYAIGGLLLVGLLLLAFTPLGDRLVGLVGGSLSIANYNVPLQKTIAEQGQADTSFEGTLGFSGLVFNGIIGFLFIIPSVVVNAILGVVVWALNTGADAGITYVPKDNSMLLFVYFMAIAAIAHSLYRKVKFGDLRLPLLFLALIFPISIVGMLKTKYTTYLGFAAAVALGVVLGEIFDFMLLRFSSLKDAAERERMVKHAFMGLVLLGSLYAVMQATHPISVGKALLTNSLQERFGDNPIAAQQKLRAVCSMYGPMGNSNSLVCAAARDPVGFANLGLNYQYDTEVCAYSVISNAQSPTDDERIALQYRCLYKISDYWMDLMEWMGTTPEDSRFTSWWDYGHWTNYFGERDTVLRNEHASTEMIGEVAHGFIYGTPEELKSFMLAHDSKYVFFDQEIIGAVRSDGYLSFGGKFGALNYLSCARNGETSVNQNPGESVCEFEHLWESVYVPTGAQAEQCVISPTSGKTGVVGYTAKIVQGAGSAQRTLVQTYCMGDVALADGTVIYGTYYLDESRKLPNGDLKLNKAILSFDYEDTAQGIKLYTALYDRTPRWVDNGELKDGWEDRKGKFYDSNLYNGFVLGAIPGFDLVYETPNGEIKVYRIRE